MPRMKANGIELYYELHGPEDAEVLVLSNGVLMSTASWAYQTPVLSKHYRLLLYDCRGMWQSDHPPGPYSMALHADDLAALLDRLGIEQAHIGGTSYGAEVSMVFALKYPERTRSLIVTAAVSQLDPLLKGLADIWIEAARARDPELLFKVVYPLTFSGLDITADLHHIAAPTLVVAGELDALKPRKYSEIIAREIPSAEFALIPHAGHAAMWERAGIFNSLILGFLAKQGR
jgi:3-oxoadipate enol-lactonase